MLRTRLRQSDRASEAFMLQSLEPRVCLDAVPLVPAGLVRSVDIDPAALNGPQQTVIRADLNGDGLEDVAVARGRALTIKLQFRLVNHTGENDAITPGVNVRGGQPAFLTSQQIFLPGRIEALYLADTNGDGLPDLVTQGWRHGTAQDATLRNFQSNERDRTFMLRSQRVLIPGLAIADVRSAIGELDQNGKSGVLVLDKVAGALSTIRTDQTGKLLNREATPTIPGVTSLIAAALPTGTRAAGFIVAIEHEGRTILTVLGFEPGASIPAMRSLVHLPSNPSAPLPRFTLVGHLPSDLGGTFDTLDWAVTLVGQEGHTVWRGVPRSAPIGIEWTFNGTREGPWIESLNFDSIPLMPNDPNDPLILSAFNAGAVYPTSDGAIQRVEFYFDANDDGVLDAGDTLIGMDTDGSNGYKFSSPLLDAWVSPTFFGTNFFARAFDAQNTPGTIVKANAILF